VAVRTVAAFVAENEMPRHVVFCCFDAYATDLHRRAIAEVIKG
jgi:hypothetical protein